MNKTLITLSIVAATINLVTTCAHQDTPQQQQWLVAHTRLKALTAQPGRKSSGKLRTIRRLRTEETRLWQKVEAAECTAKTTLTATPLETNSAGETLGQWLLGGYRQLYYDKTDVPAVPAVVKTAAATSTKDWEAIAQTPLLHFVHSHRQQLSSSMPK